MEISKSRDLANQVISRFNSVFNHLTYRPIFGGYGISEHGVMFALVYHEKLYLKASGELLQEFTQLKMPQLIVTYANKRKILQYYGVTPEQWADDVILLTLFKRALSMIVDEQKKEHQEKSMRLREYPNISMSLERLLNKIGIMDIETLKFIGAVDAFQRLKANCDKISINVMYQLDGAIHGCHVAVLDENRKLALFNEFNKRISEFSA